MKDQRVAAGLYSTDNDQYKKDWQKAYDKRTELLCVFVEDYGLTVSGPHQDSLDALVSHGKKVTRDNSEKAAIESLAASIVPEFTQEYSSYTGKATVTNNTGFDFDSISFEVELFDASNVKIETAYMSASHWLMAKRSCLSAMLRRRMRRRRSRLFRAIIRLLRTINVMRFVLGPCIAAPLAFPFVLVASSPRNSDVLIG